MSRLLVFVLCVGCGDDGAVALDAPPDSPEVVYDFSCMTDPPPTTADDPTSVNGTIRNLDDTQALAGIDVDVRRASDDTSLATAVTAASGTYQTTVATGGSAIEIYRRLSGPGATTTRVYDKRILAFTSNLINLLTTTAERAELAAGFGVTLDPQTGDIATVVRDCSNAQVAGALIAVSPSATNIGYFGDDGVPDPARAATGPDGTAIAWGVPVGPVSVTIVVGTTTFRSRPIAVEADALSLSFREP
jgi:hypothetical protein